MADKIRNHPLLQFDIWVCRQCEGLAMFCDHGSDHKYETILMREIPEREGAKTR